MKFRAATHILLLFVRTGSHGRSLYRQHRNFTSFFRKVQSSPAHDSMNIGGGGGSSGGSPGNSFFVPGATVGTILMLGALHARRLYDDKKIEEAREKGIELEFHSDVKATFLSFLPLRSISRFWGFLTSVEYPIWLRPHVYKAWAQAFHSNLEEAALPLEEYASLRDFFVRTLKEGTRPIDSDPYCLISPVDGTVLRFGELKEAGAMIEQVKGFSYSVSSLLGERSFLPTTAKESIQQESGGDDNSKGEATQKSRWRVSLASPKIRGTAPECPMKGLFYCVIYLKPGDYHRIHSPVHWNVHVRRHFSGQLYPMNERATRTIRNLYVENERVTGKKDIWQWQQLVRRILVQLRLGCPEFCNFQLFVEPTLHTNWPKKKLLHSEPPQERVYDPEGTGIMLKKGDEVAAFNMGSTVVLVFQAPVSSRNEGLPSDFRFCVKRGDRIRMGEALGRWHDAQ